MSHRVLRLGVILGLVVATPAFAHARLKPGGTLAPRDTNSGIKTGPCGATPITTDPAKRTLLTPGQTLTISWEETVNHTSYFRIAYSLDGRTGFDQHVLLDKIVDNQSGAINFSNPATYHQFSATVQVPNIECEQCTIQLIQVMLDNPASPSNYYSCADVRITSKPANPPNPAPQPANPPNPGPQPQPSPPEPAAPVPATIQDSQKKPAAPIDFRVRALSPKETQE